MELLRLVIFCISRRPSRYHGRASVTSFLTLLLIVGLETVLLSSVSDCTKAFYIHWNTTNPIFRIDNTDHIIDVNEGNIPFEYDQVNIICPVYMPGTHEEDAEKYIIYNVSKEEYDTCRITNPNPRIIAICDKPYKLMYFTITFRSFTPQPGGLEFQPGQDYYFISTSSKDDLHRRIGGRCSSDNMKVVFKVCCRPEEGRNQSSVSRPPSLPGPSSTTTTSTPTPMVLVPSSSSVAPPPLPSARPVPPKELPEAPSHGKPSSKKTNEYDKHPNEVVKNEELTYNSAPLCRLPSQSWASVLLPALLVVMYARR